MKTVRYLSDVHSPAFLAGKKDSRRELEDAHANTLIRAGYVIETLPVDLPEQLTAEVVSELVAEEPVAP